jgi:hypothetical protein
MSMAHEGDILKGENLRQQLADLQAFLHTAADEGKPLHEVELGIWQQLLALGHTLLGQFLHEQGTGDLGETITLPVDRGLKEGHFRGLGGGQGELPGEVA